MPRKKLFVMEVVLSALFYGCGESPQEKAYDEALQVEGQYAASPAQAAPMLIVQYENVISMDPQTEWAKKAESRVELLQKISQDYQNSQRAR